jgi:putative transposase
MKAKRFSEEQIVRILREAEVGDKNIADVCRAHAITETTFYRWRRKFADLPLPEVRRLRELERENARLKRLLADRVLEVDAMQELLSKNS